MTLYGRAVQFRPSICAHFDCDRCDCASLCSLICAARRIQTLQIPGTNDRLWCITIGFGLEMRPSVPNKRRVNVNPPFFKAPIGPASACMVLKIGLKRPNSWKNGTRLAHVYILFVWLVEWPVSCRYCSCTIVRVFFFDALSHKKGHILGLRGSLWRVFGSNTEKKCTERSCFMYEKVLRWFWWSVVPIVALHFGRTCVLHLPSVWSKEASVLAHQGAQEGSGTCDFFSNGNCGQVLCI